MNIIRHPNKHFTDIIASILMLFSFMRLFSVSTTDFSSLIFFLIFYCFLSQNRRRLSESIHTRREKYIALACSVLFTLFTISAKYNTLLGGLTSRLFCLIILVGTAAGFLLFYYFTARFLLYFGSKLTVVSDTPAAPRLPAITFIACMLGWLPYLLYQYPGVMTPDSINQYAQIIGVYAQSNHHPWIHTLLIGLWYHIGLYMTQNPITAISFYTIFQMVFLALTASFVIDTLQSLRVHKNFCYLATLFYAFMPYHGAYAVTIWKDVMFAAAFTLFTCSILHFFILEKQEERKGKHVFLCMLYVLSGCMVCLFRTNGWYVFLGALPFLLYRFRRQLKLMLPLHACILVVVLLIKIPLMNLCGVLQPDFAESLSIPAQQIARVYAMQHAVTPKQEAMLQQIVDTSRLGEVYQPDVYDNVKYVIRAGNQDYLVKHKKEYFTLWLSIGMAHPKDYFDAFVAQTKGYWYPDVPCEIGLDEGIYANEFSLKWSPILKGGLFIKIKEILFKLPFMLPLYGLLWSMGSIFWMLLLLIACAVKRKNTHYVVLYLPPVALILTLCLATPVAAEFRYVYSIFFALPLYLAIPFL